MASTTLIVKVTITKSTRTVSQQNFGLAAILGPSNRFGDLFRFYTDPSDMLLDGFLTSDPEYIHAVALKAQPIKPAQWIVGKFTAAVAQVDTFAVNTLTSGHVYAFTLNSVIITYTAGGGDTQQSILAALLTAIGVAFPSNPPVSGAVTGTGPGALLTLTSTTAGIGVSYTAVDSQLTRVALTANHTIVQDIVTLQAGLLPEQQFYGLLVTSKVKANILQIAAYVETQLMVYLAASLDSDYITSVTTDVASILKGFNYDRTMTLYSAQANTNAPDAAWMGYMLPTTPGVGNWAEKTLTGVTADNLTPTQISNALAKNGNVYVPTGGTGLTLFGTCASGEYFDVTIFLDWLASTMQSNVLSVVTDPGNLKIPYTNGGIAMIENPMRQTLQLGQDNQGLVPGWTVFAPDAALVSPADRANRVLNGIGFEAQLAGAINTINIQGSVSV